MYFQFHFSMPHAVNSFRDTKNHFCCVKNISMVLHTESQSQVLCITSMCSGWARWQTVQTRFIYPASHGSAVPSAADTCGPTAVWRAQETVIAQTRPPSNAQPICLDDCSLIQLYSHHWFLSNGLSWTLSALPVPPNIIQYMDFCIYAYFIFIILFV